MLVLSRQRDEVIMIGDNIEVTVCEIRSDGKVRLGINAPKNVTVHRKEVYDAIKREKLAKDAAEMILPLEKGATVVIQALAMAEKKTPLRKDPYAPGSGAKRRPR